MTETFRTSLEFRCAVRRGRHGRAPRSHLDWVAGVGYGFELFGRPSFVRAGYRMLYQDYKDGGFEWDVTYKGPIVGLTTRF